MDSSAVSSPYRLRKHHSGRSPGLPIYPLVHQVLVQSDDCEPVLNPRYTFLREIYRADASATLVWVCVDSVLNMEVIVKKVEKRKLVSPALWASAKREMDIHRSLDHPNIAVLFDCGETEDSFYILMEYIPMNDYFTKKVEVNNEPFCTKKDGAIDKFRSFTFDILRGLEYLHSRGIIHMDLKPGNLLLDRQVDSCEYPLVKLCDFGLSRRVSDDGGIVIEKKCGTHNYMAPEVRDGARVTPAVDIWCLGVLLHTLAVGFPPHALRWKPGEEVRFGPRYWRKYEGSGMTDLIAKCLKLDPRERITASQALQHPWITLAGDMLN